MTPLNAFAPFPAVRLLRNLSFLILAALWLPVTQHCALEAAGLSATELQADAATCSHADESGCRTDDCHQLEGGRYRTGSQASLPKPSLFLASLFDAPCALRLQTLFAEKAATESEAFDRPVNFSPGWIFVQRAALPPRAPSFRMS